MSARLRSFLQSGDAASELASLNHAVAAQQQLAHAAANLGHDWPSTHAPQLRELCRKILKKVLLHQDGLAIYLSKSELLDALLGGKPGTAWSRKSAQTEKHDSDDVICLKLEARLSHSRGRSGGF